MGRPRGPDRKATADGYIIVRVPEAEAPLHSVRKDGFMAEHRFVMEKHLGRKLERDEEVDHLDEDKHHNAIENLRLMSKADHASRHYGDRYA